MKRVALALLLVATTLAGDDLVETARKAKAKREASTRKVLTNKDVKSSKGKIVETTLPPLPDTEPEPSMVEKHEAAKAARAANEQRLKAARELVQHLEKEAAALEQQYYEENDLDRRDKVLVPQFERLKAELDAARADLETLEPKPPAGDEPVLMTLPAAQPQ